MSTSVHNCPQFVIHHQTFLLDLPFDRIRFVWSVLVMHMFGERKWYLRSIYVEVWIFLMWVEHYNCVTRSIVGSLFCLGIKFHLDLCQIAKLSMKKIWEWETCVILQLNRSVDERNKHKLLNRCNQRSSSPIEENWSTIFHPNDRLEILFDKGMGIVDTTAY